MRKQNTKIYFGLVKNYNSERGYGFINHPIPLLGPVKSEYPNLKKDVFFHCTQIRKSCSKIYQKLERYDEMPNISFWYTLEKCDKGVQLKKIISEEVQIVNEEDSPKLKEVIRSIYVNIDKDLPFWSNGLTLTLFNNEILKKFNSERNILIQAQLERIEKKRIEEEKLKQIKEEELEKKRLRNERLREIENIKKEEYDQLVLEMKPLGFKKSAQVSKYIVNNNLGKKYKYISGILEMEQGGRSWNFKGGFPPQIYARLCFDLGLGNQGSNATAGKFTPFKDL